MLVSEKWMLSYLVCSIFIGASLFLYGFFPLSYTSNERAQSDDLPEFIDDIPLNKSIYQRHVSRTVFMVIDAMRTDFIRNQQNTSMKYLNKMISDGTACVLNLNVEVPTVTMPRIKAMTTGTIPNFIDVVLNLGNSELQMDSLLHQIYDNGGKMVFCGDNTWIKMFPQMFHRKLANEDSLFVNDFYEGDKNITKKLSVELKRNDWEMLILHFLGLDHIGHVEGPFSSKVPGKLREMDAVIMHIHLALQHWMQSSNQSSLFIITGDHGMRDSGGHGGSSAPEINVPLVFLASSCDQSMETYNQIDLTPTLSILFGLPIPASSIGVVIPYLLTELSMEQKLFAYFYNGERLLQKLMKLNDIQSIETEEFYIRFTEAKNAHKKYLQANAMNSTDRNEQLSDFKIAERNYIISSQMMSQKLAASFVNFDLVCIAVGLFCLVTALLSVILSLQSADRMIIIPLKYLIICSLLTSTIHFNISGRSILQSNHLTFLVFGTVHFTMLSNIKILMKIAKNVEIKKFLKLMLSMPKLGTFLVIGIIFHAASMSSSSFIEEEHQTWYYLNSTVWIILYLMEIRHLLNKKPPSGKTALEVVVNDSIVHNQLQWIFLIVGHLLARRLNQTGDKWLSIPDIGDWLQMEENRIWNSLFMVMSLLFLYLTCMDFGSILTNVLTLTACMLIYYYRTESGSVYLAGVKASGSTSTCITLFWLNISEIVAINYVPIVYNAIKSKLHRFDIKLIFGTLVVLLALVVALTHKPHNIFLIALLLFSCSRIRKTFSMLSRSHSKPKTFMLMQCVLHFWLGKQFFFYQGNSNSLASIDLNAGYIGISHFNFAIVGTLLTVNTFSGPILSIMTFVYGTYCEHNEQINAKRILSIIILLITFPFTLYTIFILLLRHHIFIWSVFSPKLLYEFYHLCLMFVMWNLMRFMPNVE